MLHFLSVSLFVIVIIGVLLLWVSLYDTHHFEVSKHSFVSPKIKKDVRYVMLSDLHGKEYGKDNQILLDAIHELKPDGILIAGDMITAQKNAKLDKIENFLASISKEYSVYYANGNHEQKIGLYPECFGDLAGRYKEILTRVGIEPLVNANVSIPEIGICIYGSQIDHEYYKRMTKVAMEEGYLKGILGEVDPNKYNILLAHNPDFFETYASWGADLVLSGHVHGGIARLPFFGGVIAPSLKLFPKYDGGVFESGKGTMILSRGIGTHSPNVRFFNPGEVVVIDLHPFDEGER